jgi:uncharacterized protein with PhoU and TrkA domain
MSGPRFDPTISLGNLTTAGVMLVSVAIAWASVSYRTADNAEAVASLETRVRMLEISFASQSSDIANIREDTTDIKDAIRQLVDAPNGP